MKETPEEKVERLIHEEIVIVPYNPEWPQWFRQEKQHLLSCLPTELIKRIEHFGSTAVPGLAAKPIIDMLVEVTDLEATRLQIAPILESQGYDYLWRPSKIDSPPYYACFIKRNGSGTRTHHIHMVEGYFEHWDRLCFRDFLREHPDVARDYHLLKLNLAATYPNDRVAYNLGKTDFVTRVTRQAKAFYAGK